MGIRLPERSALFLSVLAFCLASLMGLSVGVPLASAGLRAVVAAGVFGVLGYSLGRTLVNVIGLELLHKQAGPPAPSPDASPEETRP